MIASFRGRRYTCTLASDVERDGMGLEVSDASEPPPSVVLEAFYSDRTGEMSFTAHRPQLPLEMIEWFVKLARERLPPRAD